MDHAASTIPPESAGSLRIEPLRRPLSGELHPPGDRRITHRALMLGALALGPVHMLGALESAETVATRRVLAQLGVSFATDDEGWLVITRRERRLRPPVGELDCGMSAATLRLVAGLLAGQQVSALLTGDSELRARDFTALIAALRELGSEVEEVDAAGRLPLRISGARLEPLDCELAPAAYQLKDTLLLAALQAAGISRLRGMVNGYDHLERLLKTAGASVRRQNGLLSIKGQQNIHPRRIQVPADATAAAPFIVLATLVPESELTVVQLGTNPNRMGLIKTLTRLGCHLERERSWQYGAEPVGNFRVRHTPRLSALSVAPNLTPFLRDEFPLVALLATQAQGASHLKCGPSLRGGTPDLLQLTAQLLRQFGADVEQEEDGLTVRGPTPLSGTEVQCAGSLRLSMLAVCAGLLADGPSEVHGARVLEDVYPGLTRALQEC